MNNKCYNHLVSIRCWTYNHGLFIRQCLDGFVMQKTNFPFAAIIVDDASTDNETEVLWDFIKNELNSQTKQQEETEDYIKVIATHKNNHNCSFIFLFLKYNHYNIKKDKKKYLKTWEDKTKYIAICEGDDYWTNPLKLQNQVDFLEDHPDYSCVFHRFSIYNEITKELILAPNKYFDDSKHKDEVFFEFNNEYNLLVQWISKTLTIMYRKERNNQDFLSKFKYSRDVHSVYYLLKHGKGACLSFSGGVYRLNPASTFGGKSNIQKTAINRDVYKEFSCIVDDYLLKEMYYRFKDEYQYKTLSGIYLLLFRIKRKIRLVITKEKRKTLLNKIVPQF